MRRRRAQPVRLGLKFDETQNPHSPFISCCSRGSLRIHDASRSNTTSRQISWYFKCGNICCLVLVRDRKSSSAVDPWSHSDLTIPGSTDWLSRKSSQTPASISQLRLFSIPLKVQPAVDCGGPTAIRRRARACVTPHALLHGARGLKPCPTRQVRGCNEPRMSIGQMKAARG